MIHHYYYHTKDLKRSYACVQNHLPNRIAHVALTHKCCNHQWSLVLIWKVTLWQAPKLLFWQSCSLTSEQACQTRGSHVAMELAEMAFGAATCPDWQLTPHARSWMSQAVKVMMTDKDRDQTLASRKKPPPYQRWERPVLRAHRKWEFMGAQ